MAAADVGAAATAGAGGDGADGAAAASGDKRAALRASMKQLLQQPGARGGGAAGGPAGGLGLAAMARAKAKAKAASAAASGDSDVKAGAAGGLAKGAEAAAEGAEEQEDPWPEVSLSPAPKLAIEDGKRRASELQRRGDFQAVARMWAKVLFIARRAEPALAKEELAAVSRDQCEALSFLELWPEAEAACAAALRVAGLGAGETVQVLLWRARARAEHRRDFDGATGDLCEALARSRALGVAEVAFFEEEAQELRGKLDELRRAGAAGGERGGGGGGEVGGAAEAARSSHAARLNQAFFEKLDAEYAASCAADGWDEIRRLGEGASGSGAAVAGADAPGDTLAVKEAAPTEALTLASSGVLAGGIPAGSDYYRVKLPEGAATRELRRRPDASSAAPSMPSAPAVAAAADGANSGASLVGAASAALARANASSAASAALEAAAAKMAARPRRNLDELRRVEAETRSAIEAELARQRTAEASSGAARGQRRINLDSMSDSEDEATAAPEEAGAAAGGAAGGDDEAAAFDAADESPLMAAIEAALSEAGPAIGASEPIRTKSEVVHIESLDEEDEGAVVNEDQRKMCENALASARALQEFERLGREKEALLSRWRQRWG